MSWECGGVWGKWGKWGSVKGLSQTCDGLLDKLGLVINYLFLF